jgi:neopullulanase
MRHALSTVLLGTLLAAEAAAATSFRERLPQDELIYFLLPDRFVNGDPANDRGGREGDRLATGFDPASKGFYHGGDLAGLAARLDYVRSLGATAIWLAPIFLNKPVQGAPGRESAGYHGYWVVDFTRVDPHFGTEREMQALVAAAHARGMKVYLDIIANHTADVIGYRECPGRSCPYRPQPQEPYTPYVQRREARVKVPAWLNDPAYYHNRGDSTFAGESVQLGDFAGLDDLATEHPRVVQGFIEIFGDWIDRYGIDGYRIDTARHVDPQFWQQFVPAMLARAAAKDIGNFHIFGEVASDELTAAPLAAYARSAGLPSVLDFAFANAVRATVSAHAGTDLLARVFAEDTSYEGGAPAALQLPTFISNHDMGRFASFVRKDRPQAADDEVLKRVMLAHSMLLTLRGVPVIYYGDEQGFAGQGGDKDARQDMFVSRVPEYVADRRLGGSPGSAGRDKFDPQHPLYRHIAKLANVRRDQAALRRGRQTVRRSERGQGLFVVSRFDPADGRELVVAFNTGDSVQEAEIEVEAASRRFTALAGECGAEAAAPGRYRIVLAPIDFAVCAAGDSPG